MAMIRNLTPHAVNLLIDGMWEEIPPEGVVPRVSKKQETIEQGPIKVVREIFGEIQDLPEPNGDWLIVSQLCCAAAPTRVDLYYPTDLVRDESGRIIGAKALGQN